jgi:hypothetical protein
MPNTNNHEWTIPEVGASEDVWGSILNSFFADLDEQIMLDGPLADRPDASNTDLKYYHSTDEQDGDVIYYNTGNAWETLSVGGGGESNNLSYVSGHSNWDSTISSNTEIHRFQLGVEEAFNLQEIQFHERGGGSVNSNASVDVLDFTESSVIDSADLNESSTAGGTTGTGSLVLFRITNGTGSNIDATVSIRGNIE